ncbi:MAG: hypothetical protein EHM34_05370 [Nitrosopumilales archaeon]|nr:MAG: hypothetical protein EHM34_05370 [Nitrosopumilales archaeon]
MKKSKTSRGFTLYTFTEIYGGQCSLQMSSCADEPRVWLGLDSGKTWNETAPKEQFVGSRMLINRKLAAKLALKLAAFAETGEI